jgi:hypothetical protein
MVLQVICAVCSRATFPTQVTFLMCDGCRLSYCALCTEIVLDKKEVGRYFKFPFPSKANHTPESAFPPLSTQTLTLISPTMYVQRDAMEADEDGEWFCPCCRHKIPMVPRDTSAHELVGLEGHSLIELASYVPLLTQK